MQMHNGRRWSRSPSLLPVHHKDWALTVFCGCSLNLISPPPPSTRYWLMTAGSLWHARYANTVVMCDLVLTWPSVRPRAATETLNLSSSPRISISCDKFNSCSYNRPFHALIFFFVYLARSANLYILLALISFFSSFLMIARSPILSGSTGPTFTIFAPNDTCKYLFVDDRSQALFPIRQGRCHGNQFWAKLAKWPSFGRLAFRNG